MGSNVSLNQSSAVLGDGEIATLKNNCKLTDAEIRDLYKEFQKGGGCSDGTITKEEFRRYYKRSNGSDDKDGILADNTFAAFDTDHDGTINFLEFVFAIIAQKKTDMQSLLEFSFEA